MNGLKPIKMPSAKEKVVAELRKAILSRQMEEGEVLSLDSVATQLNVSAMPVREAFQILARDGLIQLRKNKGAVVLGITETYIKEHYQLRAILESSAAALAAEPDVDISEIESVYEEAEEAFAEGNLRQYTDLSEPCISQRDLDSSRKPENEKHDKEAAQKAMYDHIMRSRDDMLTYYK